MSCAVLCLYLHHRVSYDWCCFCTQFFMLLINSGRVFFFVKRPISCCLVKSTVILITISVHIKFTSRWQNKPTIHSPRLPARCREAALLSYSRRGHSREAGRSCPVTASRAESECGREPARGDVGAPEGAVPSSPSDHTEAVRGLTQHGFCPLAFPLAYLECLFKVRSWASCLPLCLLPSGFWSKGNTGLHKLVRERKMMSGIH